MTSKSSETPLTPAVIPIAQLTRAAAQLQLEDGSRHDVRRPNGAVFELIVGLDDLTPTEQVGRLYEIVPHLVPTLTHEQVLAFDVDQAKAVLQIAIAGVDEVQKLFPPAPGPAPRKRR